MKKYNFVYGPILLILIFVLRAGKLGAFKNQELFYTNNFWDFLICIVALTVIVQSLSGYELFPIYFGKKGPRQFSGTIRVIRNSIIFAITTAIVWWIIEWLGIKTLPYTGFVYVIFFGNSVVGLLIFGNPTYYASNYGPEDFSTTVMMTLQEPSEVRDECISIIKFLQRRNEGWKRFADGSVSEGECSELYNKLVEKKFLRRVNGEYGVRSKFIKTYYLAIRNNNNIKT